MGESIGVAITLAIFAVPVTFLALAFRHFIPLVQGFNAPLWVYALGPLAFFFDQYLSESARPHRGKFIVYVALFVATCLAMVLGFGKV